MRLIWTVPGALALLVAIAPPASARFGGATPERDGQDGTAPLGDVGLDKPIVDPAGAPGGAGYHLVVDAGGNVLTFGDLGSR